MQGRIHELVNRHDESLNSPENQNFILSILFEKDGFSFCVFDQTQHKFKALNRCSLQGKNEDLKQLPAEFQNYWLEHPLSALFYKKVLIISSYASNTLIPAHFFDEEKLADYSKLIGAQTDTQELYYDHLLAGDVVNTYSLDSNIKRLAKELFYDRFIIKHHSSCLIDSIHKHLPAADQKKNIFVNIRNRVFDLLIFEGKKLRFCNSFEFHTKEDFIYYLLFVFEQRSLDPETDRVLISGDMMRDSSLHKILEKYIRFSNFIQRNNSLKYSYFFDEIPEHLYFSLLNTVSCV